MPGKRGKPTWKPANRLTVQKKPGYRYRWASREEANLQKKQAEGWEFVNKTTGIPGEHDRPDGVTDGHTLDTSWAYRDNVLMAMPEKQAQARDEYYQQMTQNQTVSLKQQVRQENQKAAQKAGLDAADITGNITIIE